ncbi:hypothetical protein EXQ31_17045 [Clostridium botulinum]|nr:hypothetical protein [Clostridium botulinum]
MIKMKIIVKHKHTRLYVPVPISILPYVLKFLKAMCRKSSNNSESIRYIKYLDVDSIMCIIKELKKHKGLKLVEVRNEDGTYVLIKV